MYKILTQPDRTQTLPHTISPCNSVLTRFFSSSNLIVQKIAPVIAACPDGNPHSNDVAGYNYAVSAGSMLDCKQCDAEYVDDGACTDAETSGPEADSITTPGQGSTWHHASKVWDACCTKLATCGDKDGGGPLTDPVSDADCGDPTSGMT